MDTLDYMLEHGHEQLVHVTDEASGLRAVIAVHSTALGPSLGGIRFWHYDDANAAVFDVLRLSEAMSFKAACAGLPQGGGKAVVLVDDPHAPRSDALLEALGAAVNELGGRYIAAEDVGATTRDMDVIATRTPWVTGVSEADGGSGDPSPVTAVGVLAAMRAALDLRLGRSDFEGVRVAVQGCGKVGSYLVRLLVDAGATVSIADIDAERTAALAESTGAQVVSVDEVLFSDADVVAPCALGGVLNETSIPRIAAPIVCGGANNQLATDADDGRLAEAGALFVPDFVANAGGIINLGRELLGYDRDEAIARTEAIGTTVREVIELGNELGVPPGAAAIALARRRIREGALPGGRWQPGSPTAWTNGVGLTGLR